MCTSTQQWYETRRILLSAICIGILNENHNDTEQITKTNINLVDGYRLRTDDVVRATCIRGVRATAVCVICNTEYTRNISTASTTAIILLYYSTRFYKKLKNVRCEHDR